LSLAEFPEHVSPSYSLLPQPDESLLESLALPLQESEPESFELASPLQESLLESLELESPLHESFEPESKTLTEQLPSLRDTGVPIGVLA
jgi:hypothetical protein